MVRSLILIPVLMVGLGMPAGAADFPKEGKYDITTCFAGIANSIDFSKTYSAASYEITGTARSNPPGGFLDMASFRCIGFNGTIDGKLSGMNMCAAVDQDGDKMFVRNIVEGPRNTLEAVAGTGKYEGIVRTGVNDSLGAFPAVKPGTLQGCGHGTGTYKMKPEATGSTTPPATTPSK
jgi:hypothetical protein